MARLTQPRPGEPIRLTRTSSGEPRYQVVLTATAKGTTKRHQGRRNFHTLAEARRSWVSKLVHSLPLLP